MTCRQRSYNARVCCLFISWDVSALRPTVSESPLVLFQSFMDDNPRPYRPYIKGSSRRHSGIKFGYDPFGISINVYFAVFILLCVMCSFLFREWFSSQYMIGNQLAYSITEKYVDDCLALIERTIGSHRNQTMWLVLKIAINYIVSI